MQVGQGPHVNYASRYQAVRNMVTVSNPWNADATKAIRGRFAIRQFAGRGVIRKKVTAVVPMNAGADRGGAAPPAKIVNDTLDVKMVTASGHGSAAV